MNDYLLMGVAGAAIVIAALLVWLLLEHKKLKREFRVLADQLQHNREDVAGLCAAAVVVDQRLSANDARLNVILEGINAYQPVQAPAHPPVSDDDQPQGYEEAIQKIRRGASIDELVRSCGLTRDEAVLLVRLHGSA